MWDPQDHGEWFSQRPSFREPVTPPGAAPCDAPLVCISVNALWVPYILGALTQLAQPSTWKVDTEDARHEVLGQVQDLIANMGELVSCNSTPPAIAGVSTSQQGCNIAGYLANFVIKDSMQKAVDSINSNISVLQYGVTIIGAIPGAGLVVNFAIAALYGLYKAISSGSLTDYTDALSDETLWSKVTCAIFNAISTDGQVTEGNFSTVQGNIAAISYTHGDVISAISDYIDSLGASGLEALQNTGAMAVYDCSSCGTGVSTGPTGPALTRQAGSVSTTILAGTGSITGTVVFSEPFTIAPIVTVMCEDPVLIASGDDITESQFTLTVSAAVDVDADTTSTVTWIAVLPGAS